MSFWADHYHRYGDARDHLDLGQRVSVSQLGLESGLDFDIGKVVGWSDRWCWMVQVLHDSTSRVVLHTHARWQPEWRPRLNEVPAWATHWSWYELVEYPSRRPIWQHSDMMLKIVTMAVKHWACGGCRRTGRFWEDRLPTRCPGCRAAREGSC